MEKPDSKPDAGSAYREFVKAALADRFTLLEEIGRGGMATVYKATEKSSGKLRAVKVIHAHQTPNEEVMRRFEREAQSIQALDDENIVKVFSSGELHGVHYIAMEYIAGETLREKMRRRGKFAEGEAYLIMMQLVHGLASAHKARIVHRDVKPGNVLIDSTTGQARLVDFGVAWMPDGKGITLAQGTVGTPDYMSPEQAKGEAVDQRSDIYSLGIMFFEMLTDADPYTGQPTSTRTPMTSLMHVLNDRVMPIRSVNGDINVVTERIIARCVENSPSRRFQSCRELLDELRKAYRALLDIPIPPPTRPLTLHLLSLILLEGFALMILCLVILVVFGLVFLMASPRTSFDAEALMSSFLYQRSVSGVVQILYLLLAIPFMMWLYRAHHNLVTAKVAGVTWRSHWSFTGFFIPVANLLIPYQFVREVWNLTPSLPRTTNSSGLMQKSSLVGLWWACLLSANVIGVTALVVLSWTMTGGDYLSALRVPQAIAILSSLMLIAAAILTVLLVNEISRLQVAWSEGTNAVRYDPLTVILSLIIVLAIALLIIVVEKAFVVASPL